MLDINVPNFLTVGVISLLFIAVVRFGLKLGNVDQNVI